MKVKIGPHRYSLFPTHVWEEKYLTWRHGPNNCYDSRRYSDIDRAVLKALDWIDTSAQTINHWWASRPRTVKIHIDDYDVWNMDHTLSLIILPMLRKLKEKKHGSAYVDPDDVPPELHPAELPSESNNYVDSTHHERWDWLMGELIWCFEQSLDESWEEGYTVNGQIDWERCKVHQERINNGFRLFGKYYQALWD